MIPSTMKQMATGRMVDLAKLDWTDVDFAGDVAPALARLCRFDGAMTCLPYSVAQHCCLMADAALDEGGHPTLAPACLLHDAHEAYIGDLSTPAQSFLISLGLSKEVVGAAKDRLDQPIFRAAGIPVPVFGVATDLARLDLRMLAMERRHLLAASETPWTIDATEIPPIRMTGAIKPWPVAKAEMEWLDRLARLCPNHHRAAPPNRVRASAEKQKTARARA